MHFCLSVECARVSSLFSRQSVAAGSTRRYYRVRSMTYRRCEHTWLPTQYHLWIPSYDKQRTQANKISTVSVILKYLVQPIAGIQKASKTTEF